MNQIDNDQADALERQTIEAMGERATRPAKDLACVVPGCTHRFRASTQYSDFLGHWQRQHAKVKQPT